MTEQKTKDNLKYRVEEQIWGHRLHDEQSGPMVALEFLNVLNNLPFSEYTAKSEGDRSLRYETPRRFVLRCLLFNNPKIGSIPANSRNCWDEWVEYFMPKEPSDAKTKRNNYELFEDFGAKDWNHEYLIQMFTSSNQFEDFRKVLNLIRQSAFNEHSNKRWTSKFVFPWGRDCLYCETDEKGSPDKRFFGRSGELLYILLSYADNRDELEACIRQHYLGNMHPLNRVCAGLQGEYSKTDKKVENGGCFGPTIMTPAILKRINCMCDDLIRVLKSNLPSEDLFGHFYRIVGLHLLCYYLERAAEVNQTDFTRKETIDVDVKNAFTFPCEILAPRSDNVRYCSKRIYTRNKTLGSTAIQKFIGAKVFKLQAQLDKDGDYESAKSLFRQTFRITEGKANELFNDDDSVEVMHKKFEADALKRHSGHWENIPHEYGRAIGLSSKTGTNQYRYCLNDELILSLILSTLDKRRIMLTDFIDLLFDKYHMVIGKYGMDSIKINKPNSGDFEKNAQRLRTRLKNLGLLESLSDGCDFVLNKYYPEALEN